jgi:hypothetical protein
LDGAPWLSVVDVGSAPGAWDGAWAADGAPSLRVSFCSAALEEEGGPMGYSVERVLRFLGGSTLQAEHKSLGLPSTPAEPTWSP